MSNLKKRKTAKRHEKISLKDNLTAYAFLAPALILIGIFLIYPLIYTGVLSFTNYNPLNGDMSFTMDNYKNLLTDKEFRTVLINTIVFIVGTIPITIFISLFLAVMLNKGMRFKGILRTIFFIPNITSFAAAGVVFIWMLNGDAEKGRQESIW
jgi:multiple sugar transport system permease protein